MGRSRFPYRHLFFQGFDHRIPSVNLFQGQAGIDNGNSRHGDTATNGQGSPPYPSAANSGQKLATGASRSISPRSTRRSKQATVAALVAEKNQLQGISLPWTFTYRIRTTAPTINDEFTVEIQRKSRTHFSVVHKVCPERLHAPLQTRALPDRLSQGLSWKLLKEFNPAATRGAPPLAIPSSQEKKRRPGNAGRWLLSGRHAL